MPKREKVGKYGKSLFVGTKESEEHHEEEIGDSTEESTFDTSGSAQSIH